MAKRPQYPPPPFDVQENIKGRAAGLCEWCGLDADPPMNFHHRYYTSERDIPAQLMWVHQACHYIIHFGGSMMAIPDSLARSGDRGKGMTTQWREYLNKRASKTT